MESGAWKNLVLLLLQFTWGIGESKGNADVEKEILQKIFVTGKFHMYVRPFNNANQTTDEPLDVTVSLYILNIELDMKNQESTVQMYFRQEWNDSRLTYTDDNKIKFLSIHDPVGIWTPDLFFFSEKFGRLHVLTKPNTFVRIYPEGLVLYSQRITVKFGCPMDLRKYPFDTQICVLPIESYGYTAKDLTVRWKPDSSLGITETRDYKISYSTAETVIEAGKNYYSRIELSIHLSRLAHPQLIHVYIPMCLLVVASWASFCLRPSAHIPRIAAAVTITFTTLIFIQSVKEFFNPQCYFTALDVWVGFSFLIVLAAFFENVYVVSNDGDKSLTFQKNKASNKKDVPELPNEEKDKRKLIDVLAGKLHAGDSKVDAFAILTFPSVLVLFNIIYLAYYLI